MEEKKYKLISLLITILVGILIFVLLMILGFRIPVPPPPEQGIEIDLSGGGGGGAPIEIKQIIDKAIQQSSTEYVTVPDEEVDYSKPAINDKPKSVEPEQPTQPTLDPRIQRFQFGQGGSGTGSGTGTGGGIGSGTGGGVGQGDGVGSGPGYSLAGRSAKYIPKPDYSEDDQGKVVVKIWVDKDGNVVKAQAGYFGTTLSNSALWKKCEEAAMRAKFSSDPNAPEEQIGTITYVFIKVE
jgi:hypothetical protein